MKKAEFERLPAGQLVRLRPTGPGSRDPHREDEFVIARVVGGHRYVQLPGYHRLDGVPIEVDGARLRGHGRVSPSGTARLVMVVGQLSMYAADAEAIPQNEGSRRYLLLVEPREVLGTWDGEIERAELAARRARRMAAEQARMDAEQRRAARLASEQEEFARIEPHLAAAGITIRDWVRTSPIELKLGLRDIVRLVEHLTG